MASGWQHSGRPRLQWQWNWKLMVFVLCLLPVTTGLGFWQLQRADEKRQLLAEFEQRRDSPAKSLADLTISDGVSYRRVIARGRYDNDRTVLLANRIRRGRYGYEVVTPFDIEGSGWVLVNRGWVAGSLDRQELPGIPEVTGEVQISGYLYRSPGNHFTVGEEQWRGGWPEVAQNLEFDRLSQRLGLALPTYSLRLEASAPGALATGWDVVNVEPQRHTAYAVQWFALSLALVVLSLFANSNLARVLKRAPEE